MLPSAVVSPPTATPSSLMSSMNTCRPPSDGISTIWAHPAPPGVPLATNPSVPQPRSSRATTCVRGAPEESPPGRCWSPQAPQPMHARDSASVNVKESDLMREAIPYTQKSSRAAVMYAPTHILKRAAAASFVTLAGRCVRRGPRRARLLLLLLLLLGRRRRRRVGGVGRLRHQATVRRALQH